MLYKWQKLSKNHMLKHPFSIIDVLEDVLIEHDQNLKNIGDQRFLLMFFFVVHFMEEVA